MNFNRDSLQKLLKLPDAELAAVIAQIANEAGVDSSGFSVSNSDIKKIRMMLSLASDDEISQFIKKFGGK